MANFRETLWFKKGLLDADLAHEAVRSGDSLAPGAVDLLPIEDRYLDDGSVSAADSAALSLGADVTRKLGVIQLGPIDDGAHERKRRRTRAFAMVGASVAGLGAVLAIYFI